MTTVAAASASADQGSCVLGPGVTASAVPLLGFH